MTATELIAAAGAPIRGLTSGPKPFAGCDKAPPALARGTPVIDSLSWEGV